jgi:hypothetical protein
MIFLGTLNENDNFMFCVLASGRKVTIFRTLTVVPSVGVFSKLAMKRTKPIIVLHHKLYSVEITYGINSVISKLMIFAENAETGQFLFLIMLILSYFTCS